MPEQLDSHPQIEVVYADQAKAYSRFATESFSWKYIERPAFDNRLKGIIRQDLDILDAGCGSGRTIDYLISRGANPKRILGVDSSNQMLDEAKSVLPSVTLIQGNLTENSFPENIFDLITCNLVLHYMDQEELKDVFGNFNRWLKKGGIFFYVASHPTRMANDDLSQYFQRGWIVTDTPWETQLPFFRRTVSDYINETIKAGFSIEAVDEPELPDEAKADQKWYEIYSRYPYRLAVMAKKAGGCG